jgi:HD superfamily phosphohydrolase
MTQAGSDVPADEPLPGFEQPRVQPSALIDSADAGKARELFAVEPVQEFFIPVWHQVRLTAAEVRLVNHPAFERLGDIYQLGQTYLVYRGATHRRWEHALGTLRAADKICSAIARNHTEALAKGKPEKAGSWLRDKPLGSSEVAFVRVAALLHDIGHLAAGHTFEDELGLLDKHDADARLNHVLDRRKWRGVAETQTMREILDSEYRVAAEATGLDRTASEIFLEIVSKTRAANRTTSPRFRMEVCRDIVGNTICADLIDYLHRDWHHLGKPREVDLRLLDYFEIRRSAADADDVRLVLNLREGAEVRIDAVTAVFELLESRYQLGEIALFHRTKLVASAMLERLVAEVADAAGSESWFADQLDDLLESSDEETIDLLVRRGNELAKSVGTDSSTRLRHSLDLGRRLRYRKLHKQVVAFNSLQLAGRTTYVRETLGGPGGAAARLATCRALEEDFGLDPGSVVIYCTARVPHAKIAEVKVLVNEAIETLADFEQHESDPALTGGLLRAQLSRFERLWRFQVAVSPEAAEQLRIQRTLRTFERTIESLILRADRGSADVEEIARELAQNVCTNADHHLAGRTLVASGELHAQNRTVKFYPSGAPTLTSLLVEDS